MSLWRPYLEEPVVDSNMAAAIKPETISPFADRLPIIYNNLPKIMYTQDSAPRTQDQIVFERQSFYSYPQQPDHTVPLNQISPESFSGSCCPRASESVAMAYASPTLLPIQTLPYAPSLPPETPGLLKGTEILENQAIADLEPISNDPEYQAFERDALRKMAEKNGGVLLKNNPRMRRAVTSTNQNASDGSYREQRERNNVAAKQSRDRRKLREMRLALEVTFLSKQAAKLEAELAARVCRRCRTSTCK